MLETLTILSRFIFGFTLGWFLFYNAKYKYHTMLIIHILGIATWVLLFLFGGYATIVKLVD